MKLRSAALYLVISTHAAAHTISMSNGFATLNGDRLEYLLRMPAYEMQPGVDPTKSLLNRIRFTSGLETAQRLDAECHTDPSAATVICAANYRFSAPPETLGVECTFYEVTVPNHIHLLRAERAGKYDRAILDSSVSSASLTFRPPTATETAISEAAEGALRTVRNLAQILLLLALALAARSRHELLALFAAFLIGECAGTTILLHTLWQPPLRFAEAAAALALAYLAFETLALPDSQGRWLLALLFGTFQGMFFALFIGESGFHPVWILSGSVFVALGIAAAGTLLTRIPAFLRKAASCALLAIGVIWFGLRLHS